MLLVTLSVSHMAFWVGLDQRKGPKFPVLQPRDIDIVNPLAVVWIIDYIPHVYTVHVYIHYIYILIT